jgi:DHHC palmitoyltransferase
MKPHREYQDHAPASPTEDEKQGNVPCVARSPVRAGATVYVGTFGIFIPGFLFLMNLYIPFTRLNLHAFFSRSATIAVVCLHAVLISMLVWSWIQVRRTDPGNIPLFDQPTETEQDLEKQGHLSPSPDDLLSKEFLRVELDSNIRMCKTCKIYRPTRVSHCDATGRCIAKFDHYCPILCCAMGIGNYKYYIQFLFYAILLMVFCQIVSFQILFTVGMFPSIILLEVFAVPVAYALFTLAGRHIYYACHNITEREHVKNRTCGGTNNQNGRIWLIRCNLHDYWQNCNLEEQPESPCIVFVKIDIARRPFSISPWTDWTNVMGAHWWEWILPISPTLKMEGKYWEFEFNDLIKHYLRFTARERFLTFMNEIDDESTQESETMAIAEPQVAHLKM